MAVSQPFAKGRGVQLLVPELAGDGTSRERLATLEAPCKICSPMREFATESN